MTARLLPVLGLALIFGPTFIRGDAADVPPQLSGWLVYYFVVWIGLIGLNRLRLKCPDAPPGPPGRPHTRPRTRARRALMLSFDGLVAVCVLYVALLFGVASPSWPRSAPPRARRAGSTRPSPTRSACRSTPPPWTYYGAVGSAARTGLRNS